jgi:Ni,Fe-hydrogenase III large subunit
MSAIAAAVRQGAPVGNGERVPLKDVPVLPMSDFQEVLLRTCRGGGRVVALYGSPERGDHTVLTAVLAFPSEVRLGVATARVGSSYPSLSRHLPQVQLFEREIAEQYGVRPEGHPWPKPVRFQPPHDRHAPGPKAGAQGVAPVGVTDYFQMAGEEVHEVAVGPVHAGVIEPGHFRFQCHGETVHHLEISLGYQHRGVERALIGGPDKRTVHYMETLAGDTTVGHAMAYAQAVEGLAGAEVPQRALDLRGVALELERLANHTGDLGAMAGDIGFLPSASWFGRVRGDLLNLTTEITGSRLGRGLVVPGGLALDVEASQAAAVREATLRASAAAMASADLLWTTASVIDRFEKTGVLSRESAQALGVVGPVARASGLAHDVRREFPTGAFLRHPIEARIWPTGDVMARARVRWMEKERSSEFVERRLAGLPAGPVRSKLGTLAPESLVVCLVEGWRGEICHVATTDREGRFSRYKVVDPSFHNWKGLEMALRGQAISDFPLINKSFNLSYCGHDL